MCEEDVLLITVEDDGVGMTEAQIDSLFEDRPFRASSGIGVRNVHDRIKAYMGEEYDLRFYSEPEKGTTAILRLPVIREETNEN